MSEDQKEWIVSFAVKGSGTATITASSEEEARRKMEAHEFDKDSLSQDEWEVNDSSYHGGYLELSPAS